MVKVIVKTKIKPYLKRVKTRFGKRQRVIKAHNRMIVKDFNTPKGRDEFAREFFVREFNRSPEQNKRDFEHWKEKLNLSSLKIKKSKPYFIPEPYGLPFELTMKGKFRRKKERKNLGSTPKLITQDFTTRKGNIKRVTFRIEEGGLLEGVRTPIKEEFIRVPKGLQKKKSFGSSPITGDFKTSDTMLFESLMKEAKEKKRKPLKQKLGRMGIDLGDIEDLTSK